MSGNLDKILEGLKKRTSADIKKAEEESKTKHEAWMKRRPFDM